MKQPEKCESETEIVEGIDKDGKHYIAHVLKVPNWLAEWLRDTFYPKLNDICTRSHPE